MKKMIAARSQTRLVDPETADALVLTGSFVHVVGYGAPTVKRQKTARRWRRHVAARRKAGWRLASAWVSAELYARLKAAKLRGETWAGLLERAERLLAAHREVSGNSGPHTDADHRDDGGGQP